MTTTNETKTTHTVKKALSGSYVYQIEDVQITLEYDAEQTNGMVSGGYGMWKAYPMLDGEILWSAPFISDMERWYDRKKEFANDVKNHPQILIADAREMIARELKDREAYKAASENLNVKSVVDHT
jgi:hypothetical protein